MKTITTQIRIEQALFDALTHESPKNRISVEELLLNLVRQYFTELALSSRSPAMDHMAVVGLGKSDASDVSERHDYYLGEALAHEHLR